MSRYDWESGTLKIPSKEWGPLKKRLIAGWNEYIKRRHELAITLFNHLKNESKGKRNFDFRRAADAWVQRQRDCDSAWELPGLVYRSKEDGKPPKLVMPKKKDFAPAKSNTLRFHSVLFCYWEGSITLDNEQRTLRWHVSENNRAVEGAWNHPMGKVLNQALKGINWTRATGGTFVGNDEYNQDDHGEGGGANYVTKRFGPLGQIRL